MALIVYFRLESCLLADKISTSKNRDITVLLSFHFIALVYVPLGEIIDVFLLYWMKIQKSHSTQNRQNDVCAQQRLRSARASAQSDQSSLCAQWVAKDLRFHHADGEDSIRLGGCPGRSESSLDRQVILLVLSCCGSYKN